MLDGKSIDTSMPFGAITGVPMATRSGDFPVDAAFYLLKQCGYTHLYIKPGSNRIKTINFVASPRITI
jgi:acetate kinase